MAALFSPTASTVYRVVLCALVATVALIIIAPMVYFHSDYAGNALDPVPQPVEFDHRHHVRDDGIDCVYCHDTVETQAFAGIPSTERCMGCHGQVWPESPEIARVRESWRTHTPIVWRRVNAVPAFVYFHHGVHIQAGVQCEQCHGQIRDEARVYRMTSMTMSFCLDCHRRTQKSRAVTRLTTCTTCHR